MSGNTVQLVGNITRDPELRYTPTGQATATFGLAVNRRWQNRQTQAWEEATSFFDVVVWRELAENASASLQRGTRVIVVGRLEQRSWETQDGDKRSKVEVIADDVAPSLRWATAQVERMQRSDGQGGGNGGGSNYGGGNGGGYNNNQGGGDNNAPTHSAPANQGANNYSGGDPGWGSDEEPF
jgi:single-strand DNA-binding protein